MGHGTNTSGSAGASQRWSGGPYGVGSRLPIKYTCAIINAALDGRLDKVDYETDKAGPRAG